MTTNFLIIGLLFVLLALAFLLRPLLQSRQSFATILFLVLALPGLTWLVYTTVGSPAALHYQTPAQAQPGLAADGPQSMDEAITMLRAELQEKPDNIEGWMLLGRSLLTMNQAAEAVTVYRKALLLSPDDAYIKMELGNAILRATEPVPGQGFPAEAQALLEAAYATDPELQKAQWLLGISAAAEGNHQRAIALWQALLPKLEPGSTISVTVSQQINQSKAALGIEIPSLNISIAVAESSAAGLNPQAIVFVFLKIPNQPGMPLAVKRIPAAQLPLSLELTDADILQPGKSLQDFPKLLLSAKLSATGTADANPDDLQARTVSINPAEKNLIELLLQ